MILKSRYGSRIDTFIGPDLYNLVMPVVPPADMSISAGAFAASYLFYRQGIATQTVGFQPTEKPRIKGIGLQCNMGDGLVDASASHFPTSGWALKLQLERFGAVLTGNVNNTAGSSNVTGDGSTLFTRELAVGQTFIWYDANKVMRAGIVQSITNDNALVLTAPTLSTGMFTGNTVNKPAYPKIANAGTSVTIPIMLLNQMFNYDFFLGDVSYIHPAQGKITVTNGSPNVVGVGTAFTTDFAVGDAVSFGTGANRRTGVIATITDATHMAFQANVSGTQTGVAMNFYDVDMRILSSIVNDFNAYTVTIDPAFGTRRISFTSMAEIEHASELVTAVR